MNNNREKGFALVLSIILLINRLHSESAIFSCARDFEIGNINKKTIKVLIKFLISLIQITI